MNDDEDEGEDDDEQDALEKVAIGNRSP